MVPDIGALIRPKWIGNGPTAGAGSTWRVQAATGSALLRLEYGVPDLIALQWYLMNGVRGPSPESRLEGLSFS